MAGGVRGVSEDEAQLFLLCHIYTSKIACWPIMVSRASDIPLTLAPVKGGNLEKDKVALLSKSIPFNELFWKYIQHFLTNSIGQELATSQSLATSSFKDSLKHWCLLFKYFTLLKCIVGKKKKKTRHRTKLLSFLLF